MSLWYTMLAFAIIPFLMGLLAIQALGVAFRKKFHSFMSLITTIKFTVNGRNVYFFPLIGIVNIVWCIFLYKELSEMHLPKDSAAKGKYFEYLYRTYRNFLINVTTAILIFELFYN